MENQGKTNLRMIEGGDVLKLVKKHLRELTGDDDLIETMSDDDKLAAQIADLLIRRANTLDIPDVPAPPELELVTPPVIIKNLERRVEQDPENLRDFVLPPLLGSDIVTQLQAMKSIPTAGIPPIDKEHAGYLNEVDEYHGLVRLSRLEYAVEMARCSRWTSFYEVACLFRVEDIPTQKRVAQDSNPKKDLSKKTSRTYTSVMAFIFWAAVAKSLPRGLIVGIPSEGSHYFRDNGLTILPCILNRRWRSSLAYLRYIRHGFPAGTHFVHLYQKDSISSNSETES